ncbi:unnamed protein product, partial [Effrenium voratum]
SSAVAGHVRPRSPAMPPRFSTQATANMVPELKEVLLDLPAPVLNALGAEGVETASDLVGLYPHVDAFLDHISSTMRARVDADAALEMAGVWTRVARMARAATKHAVDVIAAHRLSVFPSQPLTPAEPAAKPARMKHLVAGGSGQSLPTTIVEGQDAKMVKDEAVKQNKLDLLFHILLEYVIDLAELGVQEQDLRDPVARQGVRDTVLHGASRLSTQRIGSLVSSFRRWARHCQTKGWNLQSPKPFELASFLRSVSQGGPTAAASMHAALKWSACHAGAKFDMDHHLVLAASGFLVPAVALSAEDLWEVTDATALVLDSATYNRLRRFMPTLGNILEVSMKRRACATMGMHYAGFKTLRSAQIKVKLVEQFLQLWRIKAKDVALTPEGLLPAHSWTWPELALLHQRTPWDSADPELKAPDGADVPEEPAADRAVPELTAAPSGSQPAAEHAAEDSSSSASDQSADGADLEGIMADPSAAELAAWFKQGAKTHIVSERTEEGRLVPYCRDLPFAQACFTVANVKPEWAKDFIAKHSLGTLDDLVYMVAHGTWEKELEDLTKEVASISGNRIALARIRSAFEIGREALKQAAALNADWTKRYNLTLEPTLEPSEALRSRLYREFRKGQLTVIEARKVKSVISLAVPKAHESVTIGHSIHLEFDKEVGVAIKSAVDYYWQLRILAHGWAWAGNYQVNHEGSQHWMMDLSTALGYADASLKDCVEFGGGSLMWLQRNDILTRGKMATYVRRGQPGTVPLKQALRECHLEWRSPAVTALAAPVSSRAASPTKRRAESSMEEATVRKRHIKADNFRTVSMVKGGKKICKSYNDGRGCSNTRCDAIHGCDVRLAARPVCWQGAGDLPQMAWATPMVGTWLVIDLWAGISGMCIALLSMGVRFYAVAAECDWLSSQVVEKNLPHVVRVPDVEDICGADFQPFLQRRQVRGIIISGGSPRQGSSALNLRQKLDMRGQQPAQLVRIRAELEELPECASLEIAAARFFQDDRRFPPSAYTVESLLWKDNVWRQPLPEERCQMMGFPAQCLRHVAGPAAVERQRQNSLVGKGFHLPMILALFAMLPQILDAKIRPPMLDLQEACAAHPSISSKLTQCGLGDMVWTLPTLGLVRWVRNTGLTSMLASVASGIPGTPSEGLTTCSHLGLARTLDRLMSGWGKQLLRLSILLKSAVRTWPMATAGEVSHCQPDGKRRMIDNARKTLHNEFTAMFETIFTVSVDFIPAVIKQLARRMGASCPQAWGEQCPWLHFRLGTDDLPDAYRGLPVLDEHLPFSVVAIWVPHRGWRYTVLWGLAFGLESAVVAFNRFPQLGVAAARRCTYALAAAYFDDELSVETVLDANISQRGLFLLFTAMGAPPQPPKSFSPAPDRHYLGASVHLGDVLDSGAVRIQPKFATTAKVLTKLDSILTEAVFPRDLAGKLRGDLTWMFTMVSGHMGRLAQPIITKYQHAADESLQDCDRLTLQLLALVVRDHSPRTVTVCGPERRPLVIYSDASFEKGSLRLGWVVMDPDQSFSP